MMLRTVCQQVGTIEDALTKLIEVKTQHNTVKDYNPCAILRCLTSGTTETAIQACLNMGLKYINITEETFDMRELCEDDNEYDVIINRFKIVEGIDIRRAHVIWMENEPSNPKTTIQLIGRCRRNALLYRDDIDIFKSSNKELLKNTRVCYAYYNVQDMHIDSDEYGNLVNAFCDTISCQRLRPNIRITVKRGVMQNGLKVIELAGKTGKFDIQVDKSTGFNIISPVGDYYKRSVQKVNSCLEYCYFPILRDIGIQSTSSTYNKHSLDTRNNQQLSINGNFPLDTYITYLKINEYTGGCGWSSTPTNNSDILFGERINTKELDKFNSLALDYYYKIIKETELNPKIVCKGRSIDLYYNVIHFNYSLKELSNSFINWITKPLLTVERMRWRTSSVTKAKRFNSILKKCKYCYNATPETREFYNEACAQLSYEYAPIPNSTCIKEYKEIVMLYKQLKNKPLDDLFYYKNKIGFDLMEFSESINNDIYTPYLIVENDTEMAKLSGDTYRYIKDLGYVEETSITQLISKHCKFNTFIENKYKEEINSVKKELYSGQNKFDLDTRCNSCLGYCVEYYSKYLVYGESYLTKYIKEAQKESKVSSKDTGIIVRACMLKYREQMVRCYGQHVAKFVRNISVEQLIKEKYRTFLDLVVQLGERAANFINKNLSIEKNIVDFDNKSVYIGKIDPCLKTKHFRGLVDYISKDKIIDIKTTSNITIQYVKQVLAYHYLSTKRDDLNINEVIIYDCVKDKSVRIKISNKNLKKL